MNQPTAQSFILSDKNQTKMKGAKAEIIND